MHFQAHGMNRLGLFLAGCLAGVGILILAPALISTAGEELGVGAVGMGLSHYPRMITSYWMYIDALCRVPDTYMYAIYTG